MNFNQITIVGRIVKDPELNKTKNDKNICKFTVAVNRIGAPEGQQQADFFNVTLVGRLAEVSSTLGKKGALVLISGEMRLDEYEKDGQKQRFSYIFGNTFKLMEKKEAF